MYYCDSTRERKAKFMDTFMHRIAGKKSIALGAFFMALLFVAFCVAAPMGADAKCIVEKGATKIFEGTALGENDFTVSNGKIAFSMSVDTKNYWSMTDGSILDIAMVNADGTYGAKLVNDVEFLNDLWTATGTYPGTGKDLRNDVTVEITEQTEDKVVVVAKTQYWVADADKNGTDDETQFGTLQKPLDVTITYTLVDGANYIDLTCVMENPAENKVTYNTMYSGFSITTRAASMFGPFGYYPDVKVTGIAIGANKDVQEYFGNYVTTYDTDYAVSLIGDGVNAYKGSTGYKDLYKLQNLQPGHTYDFTGEVVVSGESEIATLMDRYIARDYLTENDCATIQGKVVDADGNAVAGAYVIAMKDGAYAKTPKSHGVDANETVGNMQPFLWDITDADGNYSFTLPKTGFEDGTENIAHNGDYQYQFKIEAAGYTSVTGEKMTITEDTTKDFTLEAGAKVVLKAVDENGFKVPFKVYVQGVTSEMKTLGGTTYFSDALSDEDPYTVSFTMTKGDDITFVATYGVNYESLADSYTTDVTEKGVEYTFTIPTKVDPQVSGWYCADNHQHSDYGDGGTTIENLFRAQIAAKLDFTVITDHDTRIHNQEMAAFSKKLDIPFLSNSEISPGWGHWGVLGVNYDSADALLDSGTATPQDIIKAGHENGAVVIVHHPYSDYGFLNNQASVNGGFEAGWDNFDLLEIQSTATEFTMEELAEALTEDAWKTIDLNNISKTLNDVNVTQMDAKAFVTAMAFWNQGVEKYFSAGSDQHDAASATLYPGIIRMYANLGDDYSVDNYLKALTEGHAYVTMGPVLIPDEKTQFGTTQVVREGEKLTFTMDVQAVNGLETVILWNNGKAVEVKDMKGSTDKETVTFTVTPNGNEKNLWYSFTATDKNNNHAMTNPIWVNVSTFADVDGNYWAAEYISGLAKLGFVNGYPNSDLFLPGNSITRAEFCRIIAAMGDYDSVKAVSFSDVNKGDWYYDCVMELAKAGIIDGMGDGTFAPNDLITREQMFKIVALAQGLDMSLDYPAAAFTDMAKASDWAVPYINALASVGAVGGYPDGTVQPQANTTRAEACKVCYEMLK